MLTMLTGSSRPKSYGSTAPIKKGSEQAERNRALSLESGPQDLVQLQIPSGKQALVRAVRNVLKSEGLAQVGLSIAGTAIGGPVGLLAAAAVNGVWTVLTADKDRVKAGAKNALASTVVGALKLLPGALGTIATTGLGLAATVKAAKTGPKHVRNIKLDEFAPRYLAKVNEQLPEGQKLETPDLQNLSPKKAEKLAAQTVTGALKVCCEQISPTVAVALARETAKEMVTPFSVAEFRYEKMIEPKRLKPLTEDVYVADIGTHSPAAASAHKLLLSPTVGEKYSENAVAAMLAHEKSHVDNRDMIGNLGGFTLKAALRVVGNDSWNPLTWLRTSRLERKVDLASAAISRKTEYRCDQEGAQMLLDLGAKPEVVENAFVEIFEPEVGSTKPTARHPRPQDRILAIKSFLHQRSKESAREDQSAVQLVGP